jgi:hypothetical protein
MSTRASSSGQPTALRGGQASLLDRSRGVLAAEAVLEQFASEKQAAGLDEGEARACATAEGLPLLTPLQLAAPLPRHHLAQAGGIALVGDAITRREQARQLRARHCAAQRPVGNEHREEAGKAQRLHLRAAGFERAAVYL